MDRCCQTIAKTTLCTEKIKYFDKLTFKKVLFYLIGLHFILFAMHLFSRGLFPVLQITTDQSLAIIDHFQQQIQQNMSFVLFSSLRSVLKSQLGHLNKIALNQSHILN